MTIHSSELTGFTLFINNRKNWQLSFRMGDEGWHIHEVDDSKAQRFFDMLAVTELPGYVEQVTSNSVFTSVIDSLQTAENERRALTALIRGALTRG